MSQIVVLCPVSIDEIANLTFFTGYPLESPPGAAYLYDQAPEGFLEGIGTVADISPTHHGSAKYHRSIWDKNLFVYAVQPDCGT